MTEDETFARAVLAAKHLKAEYTLEELAESQASLRETVVRLIEITERLEQCLLRLERNKHFKEES